VRVKIPLRLEGLFRKADWWANSLPGTMPAVIAESIDRAVFPGADVAVELDAAQVDFLVEQAEGIARAARERLPDPHARADVVVADVFVKCYRR